MGALARFERLLAQDEAAIDLARACLLIAEDAYPGLDVDGYLGEIERFGAKLRARLGAGVAPEERVVALNAYLFDELGFAGNTDDYYDPRNSYLNEVLDRRLGIPITLSILAVGVGRRCGVPVVGVGLPGHFIAKAVGPHGEEVLFDPFHDGQLLDRAGVADLIGAVTGRPFAPTDEALEPTPPGFVVLRMLANLKGAYLRDPPDFARAARVIGRMAQLAPDDPSHRRDLGVALIRADRPGAAVGHLEAYLTACPEGEDAHAVRAFLADARRELAKWN